MAIDVAASIETERESERAAAFASRGALSALEIRDADKRVQSIAERLARKVHREGTAKRRMLVQFLKGDERNFIKHAIELAVSREWIVLAGDGFTAGHRCP